MLDVPPPYYVEATAYCLRGTMADGSYTRAGSVAHNGYALGTKLTINGQRYVVRDRIGYGTVLDIWMPSCGEAVAWGRRTVKVREGWWAKRGKVARFRWYRMPGLADPHLGTAMSCYKTFCIEVP